MYHWKGLKPSTSAGKEARRQWGADIAHELRTPISVLAGEIQALQDGVRQVDAANAAGGADNVSVVLTRDDGDLLT